MCFSRLVISGTSGHVGILLYGIVADTYVNMLILNDFFIDILLKLCVQHTISDFLTIIIAKHVKNCSWTVSNGKIKQELQWDSCIKKKILNSYARDLCIDIYTKIN